jgi:diguanylate cyclase (GGDEF)-like protein
METQPQTELQPASANSTTPHNGAGWPGCLSWPVSTVVALGLCWGLAGVWPDEGGSSFPVLAGLASVLCLGLALRLGMLAPRPSGVTQTDEIPAAIGWTPGSGEIDGLTGLANRRCFATRLGDALVEAERSGRSMVALLVDIHGFSTINDAHGIDVGDEVLRAVAARLRRVLRSGNGAREVIDLVARLDGNTFGLVIDPGGGAFSCDGLARRILGTIAAPMEIEGRMLKLRAAMGSVIFDAKHESGGQVLGEAELALDAAKAEGPETHVLWSQPLSDRRRQERALASDLSVALQLGQFVLHYQPIINLEEEVVIGVEALLRWQHPVHGLLAPAAFLDHAEESGLIIPIGNWVIGAALRQIIEWRTLHGHDLVGFVAVNVSARQFDQPDLLIDAIAQANREELPLELLKLEITETTVIRKPEQLRLILAELQALGASISIDDFGVGYSSLSGLSLWDFDTIKIDRSFITGMETERGAEILRTMLGLAAVFKAGVVAEGVETDAQREFLHRNGCRQAQGYLFGKPMDPTTCGNFILRRNQENGRLSF